MAEIVLGLGSSHTPQLSSSASYWSEHAARDQRNAALLGADGKYHTYDELLAGADRNLEQQLSEEVWSDKFDRAQRAVEVLGEALASASPDVVVVVGDDQHELFGAEGIPAIGLFVGAQLWDWPPDDERRSHIPVDIQAAGWAAHAESPDPYPVAAELSAHLAGSLNSDGFDLTIMSEQPEGRGLGHAFTFVRRRLALARATPIVPILLNTYFPPNVPSPERCFRLGEALRAGISSFDQAFRVAFFASGGLSHFVVLEELDRLVLESLEQHDAKRLGSIPVDLLRSGTSETLNWLTVAGAMGDAEFRLLDYIPAYRSAAGTGVGMAFALWEPQRAEATSGATDRQGASSR